MKPIALPVAATTILSNLNKREAFRRISVLVDIAEGQITGQGVDSYLEAMARLARPLPA